MILDTVKLNSTTAIVKVHKDAFINEVPFIEKIAEEIGEYGNVVSYQTKKEGSVVKILFKLLSNEIK